MLMPFIAPSIKPLRPTRHADTEFVDTSSNSFVSGSFTPTDSSLLVVMWTAIGEGNPGQPDYTISDSQGLTWTRRVFAENEDASAWGTTAIIWTAPVTTGASMTVTVANPGAAEQTDALMSILDFVGYDTGTPIGGTYTASGTSGEAGSRTDTLSAAATIHDYVLAAACIEPLGSDLDVGTGWTELYRLDNSIGTVDIDSAHQMITRHQSTDVLWDTFVSSFSYSSCGIVINAG